MRTGNVGSNWSGAGSLLFSISGVASALHGLMSACARSTTCWFRFQIHPLTHTQTDNLDVCLNLNHSSVTSSVVDCKPSTAMIHTIVSYGTYRKRDKRRNARTRLNGSNGGSCLHDCAGRTILFAYYVSGGQRWRDFSQNLFKHFTFVNRYYITRPEHHTARK